MVSSKSKVLTSKKSIVQRRTSSSAKAKKGEKAALGVSFACSKCSCTFTAKSSLHRHVALKICDIRTTKTSDAKKSKADAKITAKKSFSCRRCGFSFTTKSTLDRHSNLKVCTEKSTLVKASCGKSKGQKSKRGSLGKKNSKIALKAMEPTIKKIRKLYSAKFEGNSDSEGSIDSAALEEDICFGCGANTLLDENNSIIVCDRCTGEYHLKCVGLDLLPRRQKWICISCKEETSAFDGLTYAIDGFALPKTGKRNVLDSNIVYSPSKPLDRAWEECKEKGFMCVSKMFDYETIKYSIKLKNIYRKISFIDYVNFHNHSRKLTHGPLQRQTSSGRIAEFWPGCLAEIENRINDSCRNLVIRGGRYDLKIPDFVVDILGLNNIIEPITSRLATIMVR